MGYPFKTKHSVFRIWNVNVNTILTHNDFAEIHALCIFTNRYNVAIVDFQEVNLNLLDINIQEKIQKDFL